MIALEYLCHNHNDQKDRAIERGRDRGKYIQRERGKVSVIKVNWDLGESKEIGNIGYGKFAMMNGQVLE